jgi:hypothetical protein
VPDASPKVINDSVIDRLERLADLRDRGILSDEEFVAEKRKII